MCTYVCLADSERDAVEKASKWATGGTRQFDNCSAENGGALSVHGGLQQSGEGGDRFSLHS